MIVQRLKIDKVELKKGPAQLDMNRTYFPILVPVHKFVFSFSLVALLAHPYVQTCYLCFGGWNLHGFCLCFICGDMFSRADLPSTDLFFLFTSISLTFGKRSERPTNRSAIAGSQCKKSKFNLTSLPPYSGAP